MEQSVILLLLTVSQLCLTALRTTKKCTTEKFALVMSKMLGGNLGLVM